MDVIYMGKKFQEGNPIKKILVMEMGVFRAMGVLHPLL